MGIKISEMIEANDLQDECFIPIVQNNINKKIKKELLDETIVSATEPTGVNRKKVWFKKGKNITNIPFASDNKKIMTATYDDYYEITDYNVYLMAGKTYTLSFESDGTAGSSAGTDTVQIMLLLDKKYDTMFYSTDSKILTFTVAISGNYYFRFDINKNGCTHSFWNIQLEQNTVATTYEAYIEPEIYILNNNNVYEKFEKDECKEITLFDGSCTFGNKTICNVPDSIKNIDIYFMCKTATDQINKGIIKVDTSTTRTINETFGMLVACGGTIFAEVEMVFKPNRTIVADYCAIYQNLNSSAEVKRENSDYIVYKVVGYK